MVHSSVMLNLSIWFALRQCSITVYGSLLFVALSGKMVHSLPMLNPGEWFAQVECPIRYVGSPQLQFDEHALSVRPHRAMVVASRTSTDRLAQTSGQEIF